MGKSERKAEKKSSKRKLSEVADDLDESACAPSKKSKKSSEKKEKKSKHGDKKSRKALAAEQADDLNHAEYDVEDKAIEEAEPVKTEAEQKKPKKEKKNKKEKKDKSETKAEEAQVNGDDDAVSSKKKSRKVQVEDEQVKSDTEAAPSKKSKKSKSAEEQVNGDVAPSASTKKSKKEKKDKKDKKPKTVEPTKTAVEEQKAAPVEKTNGTTAAPPVVLEKAGHWEDKKATKKNGRQTKKSRKAENSANGIEISDSNNKLHGAAAAAAAEANGEANGEGMSSKNNRFICFIGNLPFTATKADIEAHFASLSPSSVRLLTDKATGKSRGIAFVEFDHFSRMKTCLAKFHHTDFTDATGAERKINVELTAGGGGKTDARMDKVKERNFKLNEERSRRIEKEEAEKEEARRNGGKPAAEKKPVAEDNREDAYVHPSRRAHVPGKKF